MDHKLGCYSDDLDDVYIDEFEEDSGSYHSSANLQFSENYASCLDTELSDITRETAYESCYVDTDWESDFPLCKTGNDAKTIWEPLNESNTDLIDWKWPPLPFDIDKSQNSQDHYPNSATVSQRSANSPTKLSAQTSVSERAATSYSSTIDQTTCQFQRSTSGDRAQNDDLKSTISNCDQRRLSEDTNSLPSMVEGLNISFTNTTASTTVQERKFSHHPDQSRLISSQSLPRSWSLLRRSESSHSQLGLGAILPVQDQTWTEMDMDKEIFEPVSAWEDAHDILFGSKENYNRVLLNGLPGSGKRMLAQALLRHADSKQILCHSIKSFKEWREYIGRKNVEEQKAEIVCLRHIFGQGSLQRDKFDKWKEVFPVMLQFCEHGKVLLIFIFYPHILQALREMLPNIDHGRELFSTLCEVELRDLTRDEKRKMLSRHLNREKIQTRYLHNHDSNETVVKTVTQEASNEMNSFKKILDLDMSGAMFPGCCQRFVSAVRLPDDDRITEHVNNCIKIFSRPCPVYKDYFYRLLETEPLLEELIAAFTFLLAGKDLSDPIAVESFCKDLGFNQNCSSVCLKNILRHFRQILVTDDCQQFVNRFAYEGTALALAQAHPNIIVQVVDWNFILKRCFVPVNNTALTTSLLPFVLNIRRVSSDKTKKRPEYNALVRRIANAFRTSGEMVLAVQHSVLQTMEFLNDLQSLYLKEKKVLLCQVLTNTVDNSYNVPLLYWSLFNSKPLLTEWILKTVMKNGRQFDRSNLVLVASACCVMNNKVYILQKLLKYWERLTSDNVEVLLIQERYVKPKPLDMPLPDSEMCVSQDWKKQRNQLSSVLKSIPSMMKGHNLVKKTTSFQISPVDVGVVTGASHSPSKPVLDANSTDVQLNQLLQNPKQISHKQPRKGRCIVISKPLLNLAVSFNNMQVVDFLLEEYQNLFTSRDLMVAMQVAEDYNHPEIAEKLHIHCNDD